MLTTCKAKNLEEFVNLIVPANIKSEAAFQCPEKVCTCIKINQFPDPISESAMLEHLGELSSKNKLFRNYIGQGFYGTHTPYVILRNVFEDPGWYTSYTPY